MTYLQIMNIHGPFLFYAFYLVMIIFFITILEEYYVGSLDFAMINLVNEGTWSMCLNLIVGIVMGNEIYSKEIAFGLKYYQIMYGIIILMGVLIFIQKVIKLMMLAGFKSVIKNIMLMSYVSLSYALTSIFSQNWAIISQIKIIHYIFTAIFSKIIISVMIGHIFDSPINQFQIYPIILSTMVLLVLLLETMLQSSSDFNSNLIGYSYSTIAVLSMFYLICFCGSVAYNFSSILKIRIFKLKPVESLDSKNSPTKIKVWFYFICFEYLFIFSFN